MSDQTSATQQADTAALEEKIKAALRDVYDFEIGMSVVELGLIRKLEFHPDLVEVTMILTTPFCPVGPEMIEQVRSRVEKVTGLPAHVTLGMEMWDPSMMEGGPPSDWGLF